jgi:two-component system NtrC family sensor kinase
MIMSYSLATLGLSDITRLGTTIRGLGADAKSMEEVAERVVGLLYNDLTETSTGNPACVLVRFYTTIQYQRLDGELREFGAKLMEGQPLQPTTRCLTLLGTRGDCPEWNSRTKSVGHRTIPLPSTQVVATIPMVSQLIAQLGLDVGAVVKPDPTLVLEAEQHTYGVFYVPKAEGSPFIPAQQEFVLPYHVQSVLGFGGTLPEGDVFTVLMFCRVAVSRATADMFRNAAMNLKLALLPFDGLRTFRSK